MSELQTTPRLSLFQIEAELLELVEQRQDAMERLDALLAVQDDPEAVDARNEIPVVEAEIRACDGLICDYLKREVKKVDGIAFAVKEYTAKSEAKAKAAAELKASADRDAETAKRIKAMVLEVMQEFGEKKLPGRLFTITRQGNGGQQALTIAQPDLITDLYRTVTVTIPLMTWREIVQRANEGILAGRLLTTAVTDGFDNSRLRATLKDGDGVPGAKLEPLGEHIRIK